MDNPIIHTPIFKTPESLEELMDIAESMSNASEAYRMIAFTMNLCHHLVEEEIKSAQRIRVVSKGKPSVVDPEAEADRIDYEREQLMRP